MAKKKEPKRWNDWSLKWPQSECDLAAPVIRYLLDDHWEVYQEVEPKRYGNIADIVATRGPLLWVIEIKKSLSLEVIAQAASWTRNAHYVSVAIPQQYRRWTKGKRMADEFLRWKGVGCLHCKGPNPGWVDAECTDLAKVGDIVLPKLNRKAVTDTIRESLCEEQKTFAKAGSPNGKRWTPFQSTVRQFVRLVHATPGLTMKELVDQLSHHYASASTARSSIAYWIDAGVIEGVERRQEGRYIRMYPSSPKEGDSSEKRGGAEPVDPA